MPLSGLYISLADVSRRQEYPNFISYQGYYYEARATSLTAVRSTATLTNNLSTLLTSVTSFNTLEAMIVATANESSRLFARPAGIYAYYDI